VSLQQSKIRIFGRVVILFRKPFKYFHPHLSLALKALNVEIMPQRVGDNPNLLLMVNCMHYLTQNWGVFGVEIDYHVFGG
jgi:hypothetical protein